MAMALVTSGANKPVKLRGNNFLLVFFRLTPSGNYSTNGDALSLQTLAATSKKKPKFVKVWGNSGFVYQYDLAAEKLKVYLNTAGGVNAPLGEHTAVALVAGILADTIEGFAIFA